MSKETEKIMNQKVVCCIIPFLFQISCAFFENKFKRIILEGTKWPQFINESYDSGKIECAAFCSIQPHGNCDLFVVPDNSKCYIGYYTNNGTEYLEEQPGSESTFVSISN